MLHVSTSLSLICVILLWYVLGILWDVYQSSFIVGMSSDAIIGGVVGAVGFVAVLIIVLVCKIFWHNYSKLFINTYVLWWSVCSNYYMTHRHVTII